MNQKLVKSISVLLVIVTMFSLASCSLFGSDEAEETTTEAPIVALSEIPSGNVDTLAYFNALVNKIKVVKPGVKMEQRRKIEDVNAVNAKGDIAEVDAIVKLAKSFIEQLDKTSETLEYGSDLNNFLPISGTNIVSTLTDADIVSAVCTQDENDKHFYNVSVIIKDVENPDASSPIARALFMDIDKEKVLGQFQDFTDNVTVSNYSTKYTGCTINIQVDKQTDTIVSLSYVKNVEVTCDDVLFSGGLSAWGDATVTLRFVEEKTYNDFVWEAPTEAAAQ